MNDKFFDLKKEKQDRMINAALKMFALNGYRQANTDDMVREAGISKGLLFHYFTSKEGLFDFLCDYSLKYAEMEIRTAVRNKEKDYFELCKQLETAKYHIMNQFPYMVLFLENVVYDRTAVLEAKKRNALQNVFCQCCENADFSKYWQDHNTETLRQLVGYAISGGFRRLSLEDGIDPEKIAAENTACLKLLQEMTAIYSSCRPHPQDSPL